MDYFLFVIGLILLLWAADRLVGAASGLARRLGVSPLATAVIVVGLGTSLPELLTSLDAALQGSSALALGNVVGSNIANILLVLGFSALCFPLPLDPAPMRRDLSCLLLASMLTLVAFQHATIERWMGVVLASGLVGYLALLLATSRSPAPDSPPSAACGLGIGEGVLKSMLSIALLAVGAHLLVTGALGIANRHGVSEGVIGLSLVAIGTSLPELAVAALALVRREADVAVGNIIGSTLFNLLGIVGITALVSPLAIPAEIARFDVWVMLGAIVALVVAARTGWRISRLEGVALMAAYPLYLAVLVS